MNTLVTLNEAEQRLATYLGKQRTAANRKGGVADQQRSDTLSGEEGDIDGVGAELALAKILNVYPDLTVGTRTGGYDMTLCGVTIDAKHTRHLHGRLIATREKQLGESDIYALLVGQFPTYELKGFAHEQQLLLARNLRDLGHGLTYALDQHALMPLDAITKRRA